MKQLLSKHKWLILWGLFATMIGFGVYQSIRIGVFSNKLTEYTISKGKQNFKPIENPLPRFGDGFTVTAMLDASCFYSQADWNFDPDWWDWNKLKGVTYFFNANNKNSYIVAWRPSNAPGYFVLSPYTNTKRGHHNFLDKGQGFVVEANREFEVNVKINESSAVFQFSQGYKTAEYTFNIKRRRLAVYREIGTWMGGANNDKAGRPFGGKASKDMKMWAKLEMN